MANFLNLRRGETTALNINQFTIDLHVRSNTLGVAKKWYDNVVAATSYIGPIVQGGGTTSPRSPTNVRVMHWGTNCIRAFESSATLAKACECTNVRGTQTPMRVAYGLWRVAPDPLLYVL